MSENREPFLQNGTVDLVVATYSITDERQARSSASAGPYYVTGQELLVRKDDNVDHRARTTLAGKKVCSVTGLDVDQDDRGRSTARQPVPFDDLLRVRRSSC